MPDRTASFAWGAVFLALMALAIPWFLWSRSTVAAGLPVWLWWHLGWMVVTSIVFAVFTQRGWGIWMKGWSA